jgi:hypothetical protein
MAAFIASTSPNLGCAAQVFADAQRTSLPLLQNGREPPLRLGAAQEKLDRVSHSLGEFVRSSKIYCPLTDNGIEKSFHKFRQVYDWKIKGYLPVSLAFRDDFTQEANGRGFRPSELR